MAVEQRRVKSTKIQVDCCMADLGYPLMEMTIPEQYDVIGYARRMCEQCINPLLGADTLCMLKYQGHRIPRNGQENSH